MNQTFLNTKEDCNWLRETHLSSKNLNNNPHGDSLDFKAFCLMGNEDCPREIFTYRDQTPNIGDECTHWMLMDNGCYSGFKI